jgi:nucleoside-diphosphate-sugar epimerase
LNILVTGATGFLGSNIVNKLRARGTQVGVFDIQPASALPAFVDSVSWFQGDITRIETISEVVQTFAPEVIIHLAGLLQYGCAKDPRNAVMVNILGLSNVLEAARINKVARFVTASSAAVYGLEKKDTRENAPLPCDITLYGATKFFGETLCRQYTLNYGLETVNLRYFAVYGPGEVRSPGIAQVLMDMQKSATGKAVTISSVKSTDMLHLVYVSDAAEATVLAATVQGPVSPIYNIAGVPDDFVSFSELAACIKQIAPNAGEIHFCGTGPDRSGGFFDISLASQELGYEPSYTMESGLAECLRHFIAASSISH